MELTQLLVVLATCMTLVYGGIIPFVPVIGPAVTSVVGPNILIADGMFDAENQHFTDDGRLFITAGDNVYEITKDNTTGAFNKLPLTSGKDYYLGIVQRHNHLFVLKQINCCGLFGRSSWLSVAEIIPGETPKFRDVYELKGFSLANGLAMDAQNRLYVADTAYSLFKGGKVVRLIIDENDPFKVAKEELWLDHSQAHHPNGLKIWNQTVFFSDGFHLKRVYIQADGTPSTVESVYTFKTLLDDMNLIEVDWLPYPLFAVCDYSQGAITFLDFDLNVYAQTPAGTFYYPSSVIQGRPPMFKQNEIIVTDKGIVCLRGSGGDRVTYTSISIENWIPPKSTE
eukprot:Colp12_sorted_trinity150504_noHs@27705